MINNFTRWETPVSYAESLAMVSLVDSENSLQIILQDLRDPKRKRIRFTFNKVAAYRNILEEYRTSEKYDRRELGWTIVSNTSEWLTYFRIKEPLLYEYNPDCKHFIIMTEDDILEILCSEFPLIEEIAPAGENEELPGKSNIRYR